MRSASGRPSNRLLSCAAALVLVAWLTAPTPTKAKDLCLTLLHNNDGESQLLNAGVGLEDFGGAGRFATVVRKQRLDAHKDGCGAFADPGRLRHGTVVLSSGDNFLASPEFEASLQGGVPFFDSILLSLIRYDAVAIGNHEFDFGPAVLADFIEGVSPRIPFLSANLDVSGEARLQALADQGRIAATRVVVKGGRAVGIVGATTPDLPFISSPGEVIANEVLPAVQANVDALSAFGIKIIVLSSHLQSVNEDLDLIAQLRGVDVAIAGGGDELLANPDDLLIPGDEEIVFGPYPLIAQDADGRDVPVITTPGDYRYVGRLDVRFGARGDVVAAAGGPVRVAGGDEPDAVRPNRLVEKKVVEPVQAFVEELAETVVGESEVALEGRRDPGIRTQETNLGNLIADALLTTASASAGEFGAAAPDIALQNGGGIRNNSLIPAGPITELTTFDILPFSNFVAVVESIPPEQLKEIMENAVSAVENADGRFAHVAGFTFVWDPDGTPQTLDEDSNVVTPGTRVVEITLDDGTSIVAGGAVVPGAPALNIATIDFSARGGDQYPFRGAPFVTFAGVTYQQALSRYIEEDLGGLITAADYPEGGEGRITTP
jgi:5'-nucleotidase